MIEMGRISKRHLFLLSVFVLTLLPRLFFLFFVSGTQNAGVGWYGDTYHHWQIAYLTKEVGLSAGFLRLWDFKGMEYFWGLAHPLILVFLMAVTGSTDIVLTRLLSVFAGAGSILFLYLLAERYWGRRVAVAAAAIGALNPVSVFNDASGMVEPLGAFFLFGGLYFWPKKPVLTGLFFVFASMSRAEHWLFALGLSAALFIFVKGFFEKKMIFIVSFLGTLALYMKYLLNYTGNAIYPIWWNFLGNAVGEWQAKIPLTPTQIAVRPIWVLMFVFSLLSIFYALWKKPKGMFLHLLGWGNFLFLGFFVGLTAYLKSYVHYFWVVRIFSLPYLYLGALIALLLFGVLPKTWPRFNKLKLGWIALFVALSASQFSWKVIWRYFEPTAGFWQSEMKLAEKVKETYRGGRVLVHEGDPVMTYALVKYAGIDGKHLLGQKYDPFEYEPFKKRADMFEDWAKDRQIVLDWLKRDEIKLLIFHNQRERYLKLVAKEPTVFKFVSGLPLGMSLYEINL